MVCCRIAVLSLAFATAVAAQSGMSGSRPNIVFVFSDDHAAHAISAYGSKINETPNIDRLARGGMLFRNTFCGNSICGPSRATVLTGKHCHAHGFMRNGNTFDGAQTTFPKLLQGVGYQTAVIGKWHLESTPTGFDHWMVLPDQGEYYNPDFLTKDGKVRIEGHATEITTDLAIRWLEQRDATRPFLLMCQHKAPHRNWMPAPQDLALYRDKDIAEPATLFDDWTGRTEAAKHQQMSIGKDLFLHYDLVVPPTAAERERLAGPDRSWDAMRRRMSEEQLRSWDAAYAAENEAFRREDPQGKERVRWQYQRYIKNYLRCVAGVDRSVGTLLDWLDAHPAVKANTIVVYSSDQGFYLGDHGWYDKRWMYDESLRMPLLVQWPGHVAAGKEVTQLVQNIDFAPTFLELGGVPRPVDLHGTSLVPLLAGTPAVPWRDAIYYHFYESQAVHMVPAHYGVRTDRWKLIRYYEPQWNAWELFDLVADPDEVHDLAADPAHAEVRASLAKKLTELRRVHGDDTGTVGDGAFALTAGIAKAERSEQGWRIWANATGGYLLEAGERSGTTTFSTTLTSVAGRQQRNGFVLVSGGKPRQDLVRAGIEFGVRRLTIVGVEGNKDKTSEPIEWDGKSAVELTVTVDLAAHRIIVQAQGKRVEAALPEAWNRLTAWGYGASNAETVFSELVVR